MIPAKPQRWAHAIFRPYLRSLFQRRFHALHLLGDLPDVPHNTPILLLPNHSTWWDGFFPYLLNDAIWQREFYIMMLEERLREFWFFRFVGAFSIKQQSLKGIVEALDYTVNLLRTESDEKQDDKRLVVMFPQGELAPWGKRPLGYNRGIERVLRKCRDQNIRAAIVPLAMRCEFLGDEKPHVFLCCGKPIFTDSVTLPSAVELEQIETVLLNDVEARIIAGERGREVLKDWK